jgi:lysozyme
MKTGSKGIELIKSFEGFRATPYRCSAGYLTIGYGSRLDFIPPEFKRVGKITEAQALVLLTMHLKDIEDQVNDLLDTPLTQNQFDAIISFVYNLGVSAFARSTLLKCINKRQLETAASEFLKWNKERVNGVLKISPGLDRRRKAEARLFREV